MTFTDVSQIEELRDLAKDIKSFRLRFDAADSEVNWATIGSFRHLAKRFVAACRLADKPRLNELVGRLKTDIEEETETADLHAELQAVATYVIQMPEPVQDSLAHEPNGMEQAQQILGYRNRADLARALQGSRFELNESSTYGSRLFSTLTTLEIYAPIQSHATLQKLMPEDRADIIGAFHVMFPVRDHEPEITEVEFFVDPNAQVPKVARGVSKLGEIDFAYITEQIEKCDNRIASGDFEGAITNARNLLESICKFVLEEKGESGDPKADLPVLFKKAAEVLNMHPSQHVAKSLKQILSGCFSIVQGLASVRNELSDAHGKSKTSRYRPEERHALFAVGVAKSVSDFMYSSLVEKSNAGS